MNKNLKHRTVIEIDRGRDISQEPEMQELARLFDDMTDQEKERTIEHLDKQEKESPRKSHTGEHV